MTKSFAVWALLAGSCLALATGIQGRQSPPEGAALSETKGLVLPARRLALVGDRRYTMHAGIRPLYLFYIRRDNVGSARVWIRQGADGARGWEMIVGSDPKRAPRRINRWGYFSEEISPAGTALLGVMKLSDEESFEEVKDRLEREGEGGHFVYKAIRSEVVGDSGKKLVSLVTVDYDLSYREVDLLLPKIPAELRGEVNYRLPAGARGGYLGTIAEFVKASVAWHRSPGTAPRPDGRRIPYVYDGKPYEMVLKSSRFRPAARFKNHTFANLIEGQFRITNLQTKFKTEFQLDYGTDGDLSEIPVHVVFKPRWWLEVELVLDESGTY